MKQAELSLALARLLEASALLHFTGSGKFNRSLSRLANQAGWILSELGLKPGEKQGDGMKGTGPYVPLRSEREIFARLGVAWCELRIYLDIEAPQRCAFAHARHAHICAARGTAAVLDPV